MIDVDSLAKYAAGALFASAVYLLMWWFNRSDMQLALEVAQTSVAIAERCDQTAHDLIGTLKELGGPFATLKTN